MKCIIQICEECGGDKKYFTQARWSDHSCIKQLLGIIEKQERELKDLRKDVDHLKCVNGAPGYWK